MTTKYDLRAMRERVSRDWLDVAYEIDESLDFLGEYRAYHWPPNIWIALAKSLYLILRGKNPYHLDAPHTDSPYLNVHFDLWHDEGCPACAWPAQLAFWPTRSWRVDLVFSDAGVEVRSERGRRIGGWGWEDPGIWGGIMEWLAATGYPCDWNPEEALACGPVSQRMALAPVGSTVQLDP